MDLKAVVVVLSLSRLESSRCLRSGRTAIIVASRYRQRVAAQTGFFDSELE